jgi:hypothetical protein
VFACANNAFTAGCDSPARRCNGGKVHGAERRGEKCLFSFAVVDAAGQPRADDRIKLHFDPTTWGDLTIYSKFLCLPPGTL